MIETGDLKKGVTIELDGVLYQVLDYQHIKMGRGTAQVRLRLRDMRGGHIIERTVQAGERFARARVDRQPAQYLYAEGDIYHFMNTDTYDQFAINGDRLGDALNYLTENGTCDILTYGDEALGVDLPAAVNLRVEQTDAWVRGDTAQGGTKPARMETGLVVQVPLFINTGDLLKIDTRTGQYLERA
jgi:elongation factor P